MEKSVLIIEAPKLDDKAVVSVQNFLHELILAFESHYYPQLKESQRSLSCLPHFDSESEDEDPF